MWPDVPKCWNKKVAKGLQKVAPKGVTAFLTLEVTFFKLAQTVTKYLGHSWKKTCSQDLSQ